MLRISLPAVWSVLLLTGGPALARDDIPAPAPPGPASLYQRIGGAPVVMRVVSATIDAAVADERLKAPFRKVNLARLKKRFALYICAQTGGDCVYDGDPMNVVHAGQGITEAQFYGVVEALRTALVREGVGLRERNELLATLAPSKRDVVTR